MKNEIKNLLLADDDVDDCIFFKEVLEEIPLTTLDTVADGEELMNTLFDKNKKLPDVLFLDLNMPKKSGFECLVEIKRDEKLKEIPVIIFSTSFDKDVVNHLQESGANYYIRKPTIFSDLKKIINYTLNILNTDNTGYSEKNKFVINTHDYK